MFRERERDVDDERLDEADNKFLQSTAAISEQP
jgi:hypothetical protein